MFFYGYVLTQVPGGRLAELFGAKWLFGGGEQRPKVEPKIRSCLRNPGDGRVHPADPPGGKQLPASPWISSLPSLCGQVQSPCSPGPPGPAPPFSGQGDRGARRGGHLPCHAGLPGSLGDTTGEKQVKGGDQKANVDGRYVNLYSQIHFLYLRWICLWNCHLDASIG